MDAGLSLWGMDERQQAWGETKRGSDYKEKLSHHDRS